MNLNFNTYQLNSSICVWRSLVFQILGRSGWWSLYLRMLQKNYPKTYHPLSLLSVVSKVFEKLVNKRIVDHLEKCGPFSDFLYGFRFSWSTPDPLTVVFDRIARIFNRSGATRAVALDISKAFDRVWHAGLLHKRKSYGISGHILGLFLLFLSNRTTSGSSGWEAFWRISS